MTTLHEQARAEAEKRYPPADGPCPGVDWNAVRRVAFTEGAEWAATRTRAVTTVTELDALPVGSVVRKAPQDSRRVDAMDGSWEQGAIAERREDRAGRAAWFLVGSELGWRSHQAGLLPARVLYVPKEDR